MGLFYKTTYQKKYRSNFGEVDFASAKNDKLTKWKSDKN